jgi:hypothetical protein
MSGRVLAPAAGRGWGSRRGSHAASSGGLRSGVTLPVAIVPGRPEDLAPVRAPAPV